MTNTTQTTARVRPAACWMPAVLCVALVAASFFGLAPRKAHADAAVPALQLAADSQEASAFEVAVFQRIEAPAGTSGIMHTWSYVLEACDDGCLMPEGSENGRYSWQMSGDERLAIGIPEPEAPGVYRYRMWQEHPADLPMGYALDSRVYEVNAYAADDGTVYAIVCFVEGDGSKVHDPGWTVAFQPPAQPQEPGGVISNLLSHLPKTGDISMLVLAAAGACALAGVAAIVVVRRLRNNADAQASDRFEDRMQEDVR